MEIVENIEDAEDIENVKNVDFVQAPIVSIFSDQLKRWNHTVLVKNKCFSDSQDTGE